jgi:two-component system LytT family response regulator
METVLRALIVDDEKPARRILRELLTAHPNVKVVGEANSASAAVSLYMDLRPDVIFLDIQMPTGDGFSILPKLQPLPSIVFVTAYDEYAVRAFEVNAVDYLMKPIRAERLAQALQRIIHLPKPAQSKPLTQDDRIFLRSDSELRVVFVAEISGIEAEGNYSRVHTVDGSSMFIRRSLSEWESLLPKPLFVRTDRSLVLNLNAVQKLVVESRDEIVVEVKGFSVPIFMNRRASSRLRQALREANLL